MTLSMYVYPGGESVFCRKDKSIKTLTELKEEVYALGLSGYYDALESLAKNAARWNLLMQVESNEELGMMWGDMGRLYLWITDEDLKNRKFENSRLILQCG